METLDRKPGEILVQTEETKKRVLEVLKDNLSICMDAYEYAEESLGIARATPVESWDSGEQQCLAYKMTGILSTPNDLKKKIRTLEAYIGIIENKLADTIEFRADSEYITRFSRDVLMYNLKRARRRFLSMREGSR